MKKTKIQIIYPTCTSFWIVRCSLFLDPTTCEPTPSPSNGQKEENGDAKTASCSSNPTFLQLMPSASICILRIHPYSFSFIRAYPTPTGRSMDEKAEQTTGMDHLCQQLQQAHVHKDVLLSSPPHCA